MTNSVVASSTKTVDRAGYYYPVVSFSRAAQPSEVQEYFTANADFVAPFHDDGEEALSPWVPLVQTKTAGVEDGKITDTLTVSGNEESTELTVTSRLYSTSHVAVAGGTQDAPDDAVELGSVTTAVTGNATVTTEGLDVSQYLASAESDGKTLYWAESIERTPVTEAWTGRHLLPDETWVKPVVEAAPVGEQKVLAHTGGAQPWMLLVGGGMLLAGGIAIAAARLRKKTELTD